MCPGDRLAASEDLLVQAMVFEQRLVLHQLEVDVDDGLRRDPVSLGKAVFPQLHQRGLAATSHARNHLDHVMVFPRVKPLQVFGTIDHRTPSLPVKNKSCFPQ